MKDRPRHHEHGHGMPLEEVQGLLTPSSKTGNDLFIYCFKNKLDNLLLFFFFFSLMLLLFYLN